MTGRIIDKIALTSIAATGLYLFFLNAGATIPAACALAFACMALLRRIAMDRPRRYRCTAARADEALLAIARMDDAEAEAALVRLAGPFDGATVCVPRHPDAALIADDVLSAWKRHRGTPALRIVATCRADDAARRFAAALSEPSVTIVDHGPLARRVRETGLYVPEEVPRAPAGRQLRTMLARLRPRRPDWTTLPQAGGMLAAYRLTRAPLCLAVAALLALRAVIGLFMPRDA